MLDAKSTWKPVALWTIARENTLASLKPTNLRESVWKEGILHKGHEDDIAGKGINSWNHSILCTNLFLCLKQ